MLALSVAFALFLSSPAQAEKLCNEKLGPYYVNIGLKNDSFGMGLEDAFEIEIMRIRPTTEAEVEALKAFNYFEGKDEKGIAYTDGRQYVWKKEGNAYRLYKNVSGRKPVRLEVYVAKFLPDKKTQYLMRLRNANPSMYSQMALDSKLGILGVMGVFVRGSMGSVDFINNSNLEASSNVPKAYVRNADVMLYRFAFTSGFEETNNKMEPDDWRSFSTALSKKNEQYVLDNIPTLYQGHGFTDDRLDVLRKLGGITIAGIPDSEIRYVYQQCIPAGDTTYGSARAAFVPVKIKDGDKAYYPVFVFPTAFSSADVFYAEIRKALLRARWWNAQAYLSGDKYSDSALLKEALLRFTVPHMEADISRENFGKGGLTAFDPQVYSIYFSLKPIQSSAVEALMQDYNNMNSTIPWLAANNLTIPESSIDGTPPIIHTMADIYYNNALAEVVPDITGFKSAPKTLQDKQKKKIIENLVDAIMNGYVGKTDIRNKMLPYGLNDNATAVDFAKSWKKISEADKAAALYLINKIRESGFQFNDLEWLYILTSMPDMPFQALANDTFAKRLKYMVITKLIKTMDKLDDAVKNPIQQVNVKDAVTLTQGLETEQQKADAAFDEAANNAVLDANKKEQLKTEIKKIKEDLKALKIELAAKSKARDDSVLAFNTFFKAAEDKKQKAYEDMKTKCSAEGEIFKPDLDMTTTGMIDNVSDKMKQNNAGFVSCKAAILAYYEARRDYWAVYQSDKYNGMMTKVTDLNNTDKKVRDLGDKLRNLSSSKLSEAGEDYLKNIGAMNAYAGKSRYTWKSWIRDSLLAYFTFGQDDAAAYAALEKNLKLAGVILVTAGGVK